MSTPKLLIEDKSFSFWLKEWFYPTAGMGKEEMRAGLMKTAKSFEERRILLCLGFLTKEERIKQILEMSEQTVTFDEWVVVLFNVPNGSELERKALSHLEKLKIVIPKKAK